MKIVINRCYGGFGLSEQAKDECKTRGFDAGGYVYDRDRANPILVSVVEKLGDNAHGSSAWLTVVEWPDNVPYSIEEYDGFESLRIDYPAFIRALHKEHGDFVPAERLLSVLK